MATDIAADRTDRRRSAIRPPLLVLIGTLGTFAALGASNAMPSSIGYTCPFKALTGYNCPGCGMSRCVHALMHGNVTGALHYNAFLFVLVPVLLWAWFAWFRADRDGKPLPSPNLKVLGALLVVMLLFGVLRNVPGMPIIGLA